MQSTSSLDNEAPLDALFHHFNLATTVFTGTSLPDTYDFPVIKDAHMPTHALALFQPDDSDADAPASLLPIDINRWVEGFRIELGVPDIPPGTLSPIPHSDPDSDELFVRLPVVLLVVPHIESMPLLLLFGLGLETRTNAMAVRLLPPNVIGEFPHAATMAQVFSCVEEEVFASQHQYNLGLWKNVLALGLQNTRVVEMVQTAWNVTVEAKRIRRVAADF